MKTPHTTLIFILLLSLLSFSVPTLAFTASDINPLDTTNIYSAILGDVDNDGDLDMVAGNLSQTNRLYLNDGTGTYSNGSDITTDTGNTYSVTLADVDGDGYLDMVAGNFGQTNRLYLNNGTGTYSNGSDITTDPDNTYSITLGDVDGDGDLDMIAGNFSQTNRLYINQGGLQNGTEGTFTTGSHITTDAHDTHSVTLGDVDGDGDLDLIAGNNGQVNRLYLNDGNGIFGDGTGGTTGSDITADTDNTSSVTLGDVDGDGNLDLVVGNSNQTNRLYLNDGAGNFAAGNITADTDNTTSVILGDFDSDGDLDLVTGNDGMVNRLYFNNGLGALTSPTDITSDANNTTSVILGDVDGNGRLDLVAGNKGSTNRLYFNNGVSTFPTLTNITSDSDNTRSVYLGDIDGNGSLDIVVGNYGAANRVYLNDGAGTFTGSVIAPLDTVTTYSVVLGDVDGDGNLDMVAGNSGINRLYLNDGLGVLGDGLGGTTGSDITSDNHDTRSVALVDIDNDGDLDLIAGNHFQTNRLYVNQGGGQGGTEGSFDAGTNITTDADYTTSISLGDVNGDGYLDLIAGNLYGVVTRLYLNDGSGGFTKVGGISTPNGTSSISLGDVDGDGDLDAMLGIDLKPNLLLLNDGTGSFTASTFTTPAYGTRSVTLGDIDNDGDLDLIEGNYGSVNRLYLNDGAGNFATGTVIAGNNNTMSVVLGDVDSNGYLDLISGNLLQTNRLYLQKPARQARITDLVRSESSTPVPDLVINCKGSSTGTASLDYRFEYNSAGADDFYPTLSTGTLNWADGTCGDKSIPLPVFNDDLLEGDETLWLILENPVGIYNSDPISQLKRYNITIQDNEIDTDGDGYQDIQDAFPLDSTEWLDTDGDSIGNNADTDDDNDGVLDVSDAFPLNATEQYDTDGDGIGNNADTDDDGDGVLDADDAFPLDATKSVVPAASSGGGALNLWLLALMLPLLIGARRRS